MNDLAAAMAVLLKHLVPALDQARAELEKLAGAQTSERTKLLDVQAVMELLDCSASHVSRLCSEKAPEDKRLPHVRIGERLMFVPEVLREVLAQRARASVANPAGTEGGEEAQRRAS